jgi:hypothetical protein
MLTVRANGHHTLVPVREGIVVAREATAGNCNDG